MPYKATRPMYLLPILMTLLCVLLCVLLWLPKTAVAEYSQQPHHLKQAVQVSQLQKPSTPTLLLNGQNVSENIWQYSQFFIDNNDNLAFTDAIKSSTFQTPTTPHAAIIANGKPVWLKIPLQKMPTAYQGAWVFHIDNPSIEEIDFFLTNTNGKLIKHSPTGTKRPKNDKHLSFATTLYLTDNQPHTLYIRLKNDDALILPMSFTPAPDLLTKANTNYILQGFMLGLMLFIMLFCLLKAYSDRDSLYLKYTLFVAGYTLLSLYLYGVGREFFWGNNQWMLTHVSGIAGYFIVIASCLFLEHSLRSTPRKRWFYILMNTGAAIFAVNLVAYLFDVFDNYDRLKYPMISLFCYVLPWLLSIPVAIWHIIKRNIIGVYVLVAILVHFISLVISIGIALGQLPHKALFLQAIQIGALIDIFIFMATLANLSHKRNKEHNKIQNEHAQLKKIADTDPLTGLANRRGLLQTLNIMKNKANENNLLIAYFIDLDGFKQINDKYGHDMGDKVLISIANKLQDNTRHKDMVGRLGGDEFVVIASDINSVDYAQEYGERMLNLFATDLRADHLVLNINMSIGYAIYPLDAQNINELISCADKAMYHVKHLGKNNVGRLCQDGCNLTATLSAITQEQLS